MKQAKTGRIRTIPGGAEPPARREGGLQASKRRNAYGLLLGLILLLAAAVRFYGLGADNYWFDELYSMSMSAGKRAEFATPPLGQIVRHYALSNQIDETSTVRAITRVLREVDTHPPVYFVLLRSWRVLFGDSEFAVRSLSATISVVSIVAFWLIFAAIGRYRAGLFAAGLTALAFPHVFMAQEARQYSLSLLLSVMSGLALVLGERVWHRDWVGSQRPKAGRNPLGMSRLLLALGFAFTLYLAVLTHYFSGLALIGHGLYALFRLRGRALIYWASAVLIAAIAAALTWLRPFLDQIQVIQAQRWLIDPVSNHGAVTLLRFFDLPVRLLIWVEPHKAFAARSLLAILFIVIVGLILYRKRDRNSFLFVVWFLVPAVFMFVVDMVTGKQLLYPLRFPVIAQPGLIGLVALAVDGLGRKGKAHRAQARVDGTHDESLVAPLFAIGALLVVMATRLPLPATDHPHARRAVAQLREHLLEGDLIVYDAVGWPPDWVPQFFAPMKYYSVDIKNPFLLLREPMPEELRVQVADYGRIFVVSPRVDEIPNPSPQTHRLAGRSDYIHQIGWIYLFAKSASN